LKTLHANKTEILERLAGLSADTPRRWGKMTSHQMIVHLRDAFLCPLGEKAASKARVPLPRAVMKFGALYFPVKWPKGVPTRPEMEQGVGGTLPVAFDGDLEKLVSVVERFAGTREFGVGHPMFGVMSGKDWMRWGYLHCDHHLRQFGV
jgi:hypothetical protein